MDKKQEKVTSELRPTARKFDRTVERVVVETQPTVEITMSPDDAFVLQRILYNIAGDPAWSSWCDRMRNTKTAVLTATTVLLGVFLVGCGSTTPCDPGEVRDVYSKSPTYRQCVDAVKKHGL